MDNEENHGRSTVFSEAGRQWSGTSVRTLHHYDRIGLLEPNSRTPAGYRFYGEEELLRLQQILFYRELQFPLKKIKEILDDPNFVIMYLDDERFTMVEGKPQPEFARFLFEAMNHFVKENLR